MLQIFKSLAVGAIAAMFASSIGAATITINNDTDITDPSSSGTGVSGLLRGTVTCTLDCSALYYTAGAYDFGNPGEMFDGPSSSGDAAEAGWVNSVLGTAFTALDVAANYQDNGNAYLSSALYIIMKIGNNPDYLMIRNDSGGSQTFNFIQASGAKGGLSHSFGLGTPLTPPDPGVIPLPAAGWLLLGGLGSLVALRRRRKA